MAKRETTTTEFNSIGQRNIEYAVEGDHVILRIPRNVADAPLSASGKMRLSSLTGPWVEIPGSDGLRMMLQAGKYANPK